MEVPDRFVSGESGALINAMNGRTPLPSRRRGHASYSGVGRRPTLLSNTETFAQLAVLALAGPEGYASTGIPAEPGTVLLSVGGAASWPAVVEVPSGLPLGEVLDLCGAEPAEGVLVGGYHGSWLPAQAAYGVPVSRAGLAAYGGTLGAGVVLVLGQDSCPLGEVARVAGVSRQGVIRSVRAVQAGPAWHSTCAGRARRRLWRQSMSWIPCAALRLPCAGAERARTRMGWSGSCCPPWTCSPMI